MAKSYSELLQCSSYKDRLNYLKLDGVVGDRTFGGHRYLNQRLYKSKEWADVRQQVILRDMGCDLGVVGREIQGRILVHHIMPVTVEQIANHDPCVFDMNNLITVSFDTHEAIHYGDADKLSDDVIARAPNDTCPWKE